jgi:glycosyltransferase involved in cell wall biosynthesis
MKKSITIVTSGLPFNGNTINETALGGSESAVIYMARELAKLNNVTVYCNCDKPNIYDNVDYRTLEQFNNDEKAQTDVLIISRYTNFLSLPIDAKLTILWCHDIQVENMQFALGTVDRIFCLSKYHKQLYQKQYQINPYSYIWQTSNGYDQNIITTKNNQKNNYIYASRPERGLKLLLEKIWPEILINNPDSILNLCGYDNDNVDDQTKELYNEINILLEQSDNIKHHGTLNKTQYYELLSQCEMMLYPSDFPEISCINAIEAQYNGCKVITSDYFALSETVKTNTKVKKPYASKEYVNDFLKLMNNKDTIPNIENYSWENVAKEWDNEIDNMFHKRLEKFKDKIIDNLVYHSDIVAAYELTKDIKYKEMLEKSKVDNLTKSDFKSFKKDEDYYLNDRSLQLIDIIKDYDKPLTILDLGCNEGILSLPLLKRFNNIEKMVMFDGSADVLDFVKDSYGEKYPSLEFINDDVRNVLNYDINPDIVIVGELLEHIEDTIQFLEFLMQLSNGSTLFYFTVPRGPWESMIKDAKDIHHIHNFELNDIKTIFRNVDLKISKNNGTCLGRRGEPCDNWMFWFNGHKDIKFEKLDYMDKLMKTRPYKSVSVCMIVKNEEDYLSRCLKSIKDIADEIIIVDTGSTDDSLYIAGKFTDNVHHLDWCEEDGLGDFSRARNYGVDLAGGDYIFYIDADEELTNSRHLFKFINSDYYDAVLVNQMQVCSRDRLDALSVVSDESHPRLFKNNGIKFTGIIHEYPSRDDEHVLAKVVQHPNTVILHYGYCNINMIYDEKYDRNRELIHKYYKHYPERKIAKYYMLTDMVDSISITLRMEVIDKAYLWWKRELKNCGDNHIQKLCMRTLQEMFRRCYVNGNKVVGKDVEKYIWKVEDNERVIYAIDSFDLEYFRELMTVG